MRVLGKIDPHIKIFKFRQIRRNDRFELSDGHAVVMPLRAWNGHRQRPLMAGCTNTISCPKAAGAIWCAALIRDGASAPTGLRMQL